MADYALRGGLRSRRGMAIDALTWLTRYTQPYFADSSTARQRRLPRNAVKKLLITLLKVAISAAIIGYLVYDATRGKGHGNVFANLVNQPKHWDMLAAAWASCTVAMLLTFVRWWYLVRALDVPCRFADAMRISFWGYLFNLAPLGIVGGDLVKAVMLDHEHPRHRAKAVASVLVDRVIGLYVLFVVARRRSC